MEDSAYQALYTGVYVFIFIIALSATIYLFMSITDYAELSYEYSNTALDSNIIENIPTSKYQILTGSDVIVYYYNYIKHDKYESDVNEQKYNVIIDGINANNLTYKKLKDTIINYNSTYKIEYVSENNKGIATIRIEKINNVIE